MTDQLTQPRTITADFEVTGWDDDPYLETPDGLAMSRVTVTKTFTGALAGTSSTQLLAAGAAGGRGYVASERFEGTVEGRAGSFVMQHGGVGGEQDAPRSFGNIVPGCGTGELTGLRGTVEYRHDEAGAVITLVLG